MDRDIETARFLYELGVLKRVRRSGWWLAGIRDPESVAEHSFRAAAIAWVLARLEGADAGKAVAMAVFHDAPETRLNDGHRLARSYVDWSEGETRAAGDQIRNLPDEVGAPLRSLRVEAKGGESIEAKVARDADRLECLLQAREYAAEGRQVEPWIRSSVAELSTEGARRLARAILAESPDGWRGDEAPGGA